MTNLYDKWREGKLKELKKPVTITLTQEQWDHIWCVLTREGKRIRQGIENPPTREELEKLDEIIGVIGKDPR